MTWERKVELKVNQLEQLQNENLAAEYIKILQIIWQLIIINGRNNWRTN